MFFFGGHFPFFGGFGGGFGGGGSFGSLFIKPRYRFDVDLGGGPLLGFLIRY
jgi:hypothetical protein